MQMSDLELSDRKKRKRRDKRSIKIIVDEENVPQTIVKPLIQNSETNEDVKVKKKKSPKALQVETVTKQHKKLKLMDKSELNSSVENLRYNLNATISQSQTDESSDNEDDKTQTVTKSLPLNTLEKNDGDLKLNASNQALRKHKSRFDNATSSNSENDQIQWKKQKHENNSTLSHNSSTSTFFLDDGDLKLNTSYQALSRRKSRCDNSSNSENDQIQWKKQKRENNSTLSDNSSTSMFNDTCDNANTTNLQQENDELWDDENDTFTKNSNNKTQTVIKSLQPQISKRSDGHFKSNILNQTFPVYKSKFNNFHHFATPGSSYAPSYKQHQLIGDSQLLRFTKQLIHYKKHVFNTDSKSRGIGYCISGQKTADLEQQLLKKPFEIHDQVILLIGTNDFLWNVPVTIMIKNFTSILTILKTNDVQRIVVLTVPPVPKLVRFADHLKKLHEFNEFITNQAEGNKVVVLDLASLFIGYNNKISLNYFEETYFPTNKPDLIHMNLQGLKMLQSLLNILYFDKRS